MFSSSIFGSLDQSFVDSKVIVRDNKSSSYTDSTLKGSLNKPYSAPPQPPFVKGKHNMRETSISGEPSKRRRRAKSSFINLEYF